MSPSIRVQVEGVPPIKRGAESMWGKQLDRVQALRRQAVKHTAGLEPATIADDAKLRVEVWAVPQDGDLDGFVAGICDGLQPCHANYRKHIRPGQWAHFPAAAGPTKGLGILDDRSITSIHAVRHPPDSFRHYLVVLTW